MHGNSIGVDGVAKSPPTYTTGAAAKACGVSQQTIIRYFDAGRLGGFRVPGSKFRRVTRAGLLAFMLKNGIDPSPIAPFSEPELSQIAKAKGQATGEVVGPVRLENRIAGFAEAA